LGSDPKEFYVWVDPTDFLVRHNAGLVGVFTCGPMPGVDAGTSKLMFIPNPKFSAHISPFQHGMIRAYLADYNLELTRAEYFPRYPSRLDACFLLQNAETAHQYEAAHPEHVKGRSLKQVVTEGTHVYSIHDAGWIDFLRGPGSKDQETLKAVGDRYWSGQPAAGPFTFMGEETEIASVPEVLLYGSIRFVNRDLAVSDA
jgi:hypothetical protein